MLHAQWLETFVTLCEEQHFTRAAERLHMTQPGVSQHLRKLEDQVGHALVLRDSGQFILTRAGEEVLAVAQSRRTQEQALRAVLEYDDPDRGEVRLACSGSFATLLYPALLSRMAQAPGLSVHLEAAPQETVISGVLDGRFHLGIADHEPSHTRLNSEHLGAEELCLAVPHGFSITPTFEQLEGLGFIAHPDGYAYADELLPLNYSGQFTGSDRLRTRGFVNQIGQILAPVAQGLGYTILPRSGIDAFAGKDQVRVARLTHPVQHELWAVRRAGNPLPSRFERVEALLESLARTLSDDG